MLIAGERGSDDKANPWGREHKGARGNELCAKALDDENVILYDYRAKGYKSLVVEDWSMG